MVLLKGGNASGVAEYLSMPDQLVLLEQMQTPVPHVVDVWFILAFTRHLCVPPPFLFKPVATTTASGKDKEPDSESGGGMTGTIIGVSIGLAVLVGVGAVINSRKGGNTYHPVEMVDLDGAADDIKEDDDDDMIIASNDPVMGAHLNFTPPEVEVRPITHRLWPTCSILWCNFGYQGG